MQRVLTNYEEGDELEIRYYLDPRAKHPADCLSAKHPAGFRLTVEKIITRMGGIEQAKHIPIIDLHYGELRKRITFENGDRTEVWVEKHKKSDWVEPNDFGGLRISLAKETMVDSRKLNKVDRITVKYRISFSLDCSGTPCKYDPTSPWLMDISAVKICELGNIQDAKTKLLTCVNPMDLWAWWDHWEFERELNPNGAIPGISLKDTVELLELDDLYQSYSILAPDVDYDMLDAVRRIALMINHPKAQQFQRLSPRNTIARLLPKAIEPTLECWIEDYFPKVNNMIIRDKIDGTRELVWIQNGKLTCIDAKGINTWDEPDCEETYIFDCEFLNDVWYVLHPLVWKGKNVTDMNDADRLELLKNLPAIPGLAVCPAKLIKDTSIKSWWNRRPPYHRDGLILSTGESYWSQSNAKWKPAEESTIDMLIVKCPDWLMGKAPFIRNSETDTLYLLNVGVNSGVVTRQYGFPLKRYLDIFHLDKTARYVPQPFSPPNNPLVYVWSTNEDDLDGFIGEFIYEEGWKLRRRRNDKPSLMRGGTEIGNDIKTAQDVWSKIENPFPLEYLWQPPAKRASRYDSLAVPIARIVSEMVEEEVATSAIIHCCPFIPFEGIHVRGALLPDKNASGFPTIADYRPDLSNNSRIHQINYSQIGRIELPKEFIGGAQLFVTMDPELLGHVSCLGKCVAPGGRMVIIVRMVPGDDAHPEVGRSAIMKDMDRAGFTLITDHGAPETDAWDVSNTWGLFSILSFRKDNRGTSEMKPEEVRKENPHIAANTEANYSYKFSRQKTKDIAGLIGPSENCNSLHCDPKLGQVLVDIEFLTTLQDDAQVFYDGANLDKLRQLFPKMTLRGDNDAVRATCENVEALICHSTYSDSLEFINTYKPNYGLLDFDHQELAVHKIIKGRVMLYPYANVNSTRVAVMYGRDRSTWNITPSIFEQEMHTFHKVYRPSAFRYSAKRAGFDSCYDCRASIFIMTKYAKTQKITLDEAYSRL